MTRRALHLSSLAVEATIRDFRPEDLGRLIKLLEESGGEEAYGPRLDQAVDLISTDDGITLVAEAGGDMVGAVLATFRATIGRIHRLVLMLGGQREAGVADGLLEEIENRLADIGVRTINASVKAEGSVRAHLERRDYAAIEGALQLRREIPASPTVPSGLADVFGRIVRPGLWGELKGLEDAKEIIERRVILPLARPDLAVRHAVSPPKAIVLFGPPGTGKTTFALGIASRLGWPFVEIQPSELRARGPSTRHAYSHPRWTRFSTSAQRSCSSTR